MTLKGLMDRVEWGITRPGAIGDGPDKLFQNHSGNKTKKDIEMWSVPLKRSELFI